MKNKKILIIEDEDLTRHLCEAILCKEGHDVLVAENVVKGRAIIQRTNLNLGLVVLDLNLPDGDGLELAREQQLSQRHVPVLMMTARVRPEERVTGFESGALDYLIKPFHPNELIYRVRNIFECNRYHGNYLSEDGQFRYGAWLLDMEAREFQSDDGRRVELTRGEFDLLAKLALARGGVCSRESLIECIARGMGEGHSRTVDVLVSRLRRKILQQRGMLVRIYTVPGVGYKLTTPD